VSGIGIFVSLSSSFLSEISALHLYYTMQGLTWKRCNCSHSQEIPFIIEAGFSLPSSQKSAFGHLSWSNLILSTPSDPLSLKFILVFFSYLRVGRRADLFTYGFLSVCLGRSWVPRCILGPCTAAIDVCPFGLLYISTMIDWWWWWWRWFFGAIGWMNLAGETKVLGGNLPRRHFVHHKIPHDDPVSNSGPQWWEASD
jgi:hypothetical protein